MRLGGHGNRDRHVSTEQSYGRLADSCILFLRQSKLGRAIINGWQPDFSHADSPQPENHPSAIDSLRPHYVALHTQRCYVAERPWTIHCASRLGLGWIGSRTHDRKMQEDRGVSLLVSSEPSIERAMALDCSRGRTHRDASSLRVNEKRHWNG